MKSGKRKIMVIGEKETFLIRVLIKKLGDEGFETFFVQAEIDRIASKWNEADSVTYYLDNAEKVKPDVMHFLNDKLNETDKKIVFIGEKNDADETKRYIASDVILEIFLRPLDTDKYAKRLKEYFAFAESEDAKKTILIIDDDPTYMGVIRNWLKGIYKVAMANSGTQALTWLGMNKADLILLDYEMPVVSGPQVLEMMRSEPGLSSIPVFFLTSHSDKESVMSVMELKPENYLLKTIEKDDLIAKLKKFFDSRK